MGDARELTITDDFMFGSVFSDLELCKGLLEIILGTTIASMERAELQEPLAAGPLSRAGIVDLLVRDEEGNAYDVEMQNEVRQPYLVRRARYYGSLVDTAMLDRGASFGDLRDRVVIFICADDPFGLGYKRYNFQNVCLQDGELQMCDGSEFVFVNARGVRGDSTPSLDALLGYLADDDIVESDYVNRVDQAVRTRRADPKWRRNMMLWSQKYRDDFARARMEGRDLGLEEGREEGRKKGLEEGRQEGREEGRQQAVSDLSLLAQKLDDSGRSSELSQAIRDPERLDALLGEFGIK